MKYSIKVDQAIRDTVSQLSDETLLAYVTCPNYRAEDMSEINDSYLMFLHPNTLETSKQAIQTLRSQIQHPILVASDMEAGPGTAIFGATTFPSMRAVAETKCPQLAYEMGKIAALEAREIGYNWTFAPCVDILGNHFSPITSIRSAGEDVKDVLSYTTQYMKGLQDHGLIATAKHFPGDGYSAFDQHLTTAINPLSKEEWDQSFRLVYQNIINEGVRAMMPGHIALPCYDEIDPKTGLFPPATLSSLLLTHLLKQNLGFEGLIISDATEMSGFCGYINFYDACARFLMSGGDVLLFAHPNPTFIAEMKKRMQTGQLTKDVLIDRVCRILAFCQDHFSITYPLHFHLAEHQKIADEVVRQSVRIYRDRHQILPIRMYHPKIAHVVIAQQIQKSKHEDNICLTLAFLCMITEMAYFWRLVGVPSLHPNPTDHLPITMCGWGIIFSGFLILTKRQTLFDITYFWLFSGTLFALLTPTVITTCGPTRFRYYQFWLEHTLGYIVIFYMMFVHQMRPQVKSIFKSLGALAVLAIVAIFANHMLPGANYLFVAQPEDAPSFLDFLPKNYPLRIAIMGCIVTCLFCIAYLPWFMMDRKKKKLMTQTSNGKQE